jgi:hypothetical protein
VLARFTQGGGEAFVLGDGLLELALRLEDLLLEGAHSLGCVLEPAAEDDHLFLQPLELTLEVADLALVLSETPVVLGSHASPPGSDVERYAWRRTLHRAVRGNAADSACSRRRHTLAANVVTLRFPGIFPGLD